MHGLSQKVCIRSAFELRSIERKKRWNCKKDVQRNGYVNKRQKCFRKGHCTSYALDRKQTFLR